MSFMTELRRLTRLVLVWYVLFVGVSVLAATLQPKTMEVVCSSMGLMKVVVQGEGGDSPGAQQHGLPAVRPRHARPAAAHGGRSGPCARCPRAHRAAFARGRADRTHGPAFALSRAARFELILVEPG
jgi:hypothetical protein